MSMSKLDFPQVIKTVFDETEEALKVNVVSSSGSTSTVDIISGDGSGDKALVTPDNALKVDGSAVTQPISATSLPLPADAATETTLAQLNGKVTVVDTSDVTVTSSVLPTGAATEAKQPALGTAGSASSDVITVQGIASMTPITVSGSITPVTPTALTIKQAAITVGTSAVRLTTDGSAPSSTRVLLIATPDPSSSATFYVGSSSVTNSGGTRGIPLNAAQPFIANMDAGDYYIIASTSGQTVFVVEQE